MFRSVFTPFTNIFPGLPLQHLLIAEDDKALQQVLLTFCSSFGGLKVIGPTQKADRASALVTLARPELALIDIRLLDGTQSGFQVADTCLLVQTQIIFMTSFFSNEEILRKAAGYRPAAILNKPVTAQVLYLSILTAIGRDYSFSPAVGTSAASAKNFHR